MNIGDKVTAKCGKGKQFEIVDKLAMASVDYPDGWAYLLKDEDGNETWTNSTCIVLEDFELTLFDRLNVIKDAIAKYGEDNFYLSFSGGKDSTILHRMIDMAVPNNRIPRVFIDTGIEYNAIKRLCELSRQRGR